MVAMLKALVTVLVAGVASMTTAVTIGQVHPPAAPIHPVRHAASGSTTEAGDLPAGMFSSNPALPAPAPEAGASPSEEAAPAQPDAAAPAVPAPVLVRQPAPVAVGSAQQALINADRAAAGLPPLAWSSCLAGIAAGQSQAMAARGAIFHGSGVNADFGCGLGSAQTGENVGYWSGGINDAQLNTMFMNSPEHRANIMGPYHYVGTAWVRAANGFGYITVEFA